MISTKRVGGTGCAVDGSVERRGRSKDYRHYCYEISVWDDLFHRCTETFFSKTTKPFPCRYLYILYADDQGKSNCNIRKSNDQDRIHDGLGKISPWIHGFVPGLRDHLVSLKGDEFKPHTDKNR